ncbi:hypothetical protein TSUD_248710 [Trifolium subterraneum]|uniref:peroxidase n=1 Tax=Trifolium subterraneum TaxID=3900 RepID=A0A2Z6M006_TRISU|nr:hypothetical protein TSUD_248710 [Trifolium subterraneum]
MIGSEKGCDGSVQLDDTSNFTGEKTAIPNKNSARGFEVIDQIMSPVKEVCPGGHTIGQARCTNFRAHIYNDTDIDTSFARTRQSGCPKTSGSGDNNLAPLDLVTPTSFDNHYFKNLVDSKGLLHSDQVLFNGGSADSIVHEYSTNPSSFFSDFITAMIKMGDISLLTGSNGEIRKNCRRAN